MREGNYFWILFSLILIHIHVLQGALLSSFDFLQEDCYNNTIVDNQGSDQGPLNFEGKFLCFQDRNGIFIPEDEGPSSNMTRTKTEMEVSTLLPLIQSSHEMSIELWYKLDEGADPNDEILLLSMSKLGDTQALLNCEVLGQQGFVFTLEVRPSTGMIAAFVCDGQGATGGDDLDGYWPYQFEDTGFDPYNYTQLILTFDQYNISLFVNGVRSSGVSLNPDMDYYIDELMDGTMTSLTDDIYFNLGTIFNVHSRMVIDNLEGPVYANTFFTPFMGTFFSFNVFDSAFDDAGAATEYAAGIPNNAPFAENQTITINEDGEIVFQGELPNNPPYYYTDLPFTDIRVSLVAYDIDDDPFSPNYAGAGSEPTTITLHEIPTNGFRIYTEDQTEITTPGFVLTALTGWDLYLRPPTNYYSPTSYSYPNYDSFVGRLLYTISDGSRSDVGETGFSVTSVNDPPFVPNTNASVMSRLFASITLNASDVDSTVFDTMIIHTLPANGSLYTVDSNGNPKTLITDAGTIVNNDKFAYVYTGNEEIPSSSALGTPIATDSFLVNISDDLGVFSPHGKVTFTVMGSFIPLPSSEEDLIPVTSTVYGGLDTDVFIQEDDGDAIVNEDGVSDTTITLFGYNFAHDDLNRFVDLYVEAPPSDGTLLYANATISGSDVMIAEMGGVAEDDGAYTLSMNYVGETHSFNLPTTTWNGSDLSSVQSDVAFDFFLADNKTSVVRSPALTQHVYIRNVNDQPTLTVPSGTFQVDAVSANKDNSDVLFISGIDVEDDLDLDVDLVRVHVETSRGGKVSLDDDFVDDVDFNSASFCRLADSDGRWGCQGSGSSDEDMNFVGTPEAVRKALATIKYQNVNPNVIDTITITVYDGAYDSTSPTRECIDQEDHDQVNPYTVHVGCYSVSGEITVEVGTFAGEETDDGTQGFTSQLTGAVVGAGLVVSLAAFVSFRKCFSGSEANTTWDEEDDGHDEV